MYNRVPVVRVDEVASPSLDESWRDAGIVDGWRTFVARPAGDFASEREMTKLYVSPQPQATAAALRAVVSTFAAGPKPLAFKVAATSEGLCRPDKLVVYFGGRDELVHATPRLSAALGALPAQGVPFTAALTPDGLLSWGVDPPADVAGPGGNRHSWRSWVTYRLAHHLVATEAADPAAVAADLVRRDGIDPLTWQPETGVWDRARRGGGA